jgi:hypothetical protein
MKTEEKKSAKSARFRPGSTGECEAQLWSFTGPARILNDSDAPVVQRETAESLEAALRYMRQRRDHFIITAARFLGMIPRPLRLPTRLKQHLSVATPR